MREPRGGQDGAKQTMGMYTKDSAFSRVLKLQEALYKIQGRIAKITDSLRMVRVSKKTVLYAPSFSAFLLRRGAPGWDPAAFFFPALFLFPGWPPRFFFCHVYEGQRL